MARAGIEKGEVSETILGQVLTAAQGQNPARQAHVNAGLPIESAAWSFGLALVLVLMYMVFYYNTAGWAANIALVANIVCGNVPMRHPNSIHQTE